MFWKAASTLVESNAEVSINDNSFLSETHNTPIYNITELLTIVSWLSLTCLFSTNMAISDTH